MAPPGETVVSLVMASRNGERFLPAALESIAAQTWPWLEVILVDDGSTDRTRALFDGFVLRHPRARAISTSSVGPGPARNAGIAAASGDWVAIHDDDDVSRPERIEREAAFLGANPGVGLVGSAATIIDAEGRDIGRYAVPLSTRGIATMLGRAPAFVHGSVLMRREVFLAAGGYRSVFPVAEDFDLYLRMASRVALANLSEPLYAWRSHPSNTHSRRRDEHLFYAALARVFAWERAHGGGDSAAELESSPAVEDFVHGWRHAARLARYRGEGLVREGRVAEARALLSQSLADPAVMPGGALWWAMSWGVGLTPRARRARRARCAARVPGAAA